MSAGSSPLFSLIVCFLVRSSEAQEKITADVGEDATLPCKVPNKYNINNNIAVEWIRPDQDPEYVLLYRNGGLDPENQHPSYQNRVDLQDKEMKDGNVSLILKNVTMEDSAIYVCRVFEKGKNELINTIYLEVHPPDQEKNKPKLGEDATLPCKVPNKYNINNNIAVEWSRPDQDPEYVLLYQDGRLDPDNQHPSYQNRVDLQDKEMKDGNVSLILKNVKLEDDGIYACRVLEEGKYELISIIYLEVHPPGEKHKRNKGGAIVGSVVGVILLAVASVGFSNL